jgi:hypothetical protein
VFWALILGKYVVVLDRSMETIVDDGGFVDGGYPKTNAETQVTGAV